MRETIVITWDEWKASREAKRENLRRLGLDAPSRRKTDYGNAGRRLRKAFGGMRAPSNTYGALGDRALPCDSLSIGSALLFD